MEEQIKTKESLNEKSVELKSVSKPETNENSKTYNEYPKMNSEIEKNTEKVELKGVSVKPGSNIADTVELKEIPMTVVNKEGETVETKSAKIQNSTTIKHSGAEIKTKSFDKKLETQKATFNSHKMTEMSPVKPVIAEVSVPNINENYFLVSNVVDPKSLKLASNKPDKFKYTISPTDQDNTYRIDFKASNEIVDIKVMTTALNVSDRFLAKNGKFRLMPDSMESMSFTEEKVENQSFKASEKDYETTQTSETISQHVTKQEEQNMNDTNNKESHRIEALNVERMGNFYTEPYQIN